MSNLDLKIVSFVDTFMLKNTVNINPLLDNLNENGSNVIQDIQSFVRKLDFPYDLEYLCFDLLNESKHNNIKANEILLALNVAINMFKRRKRQEPIILPVWTGPYFEESPIIHKTYETVKRMFETAKYDILIVGYTFSFDTSYLVSLFEEVIKAARRGCRIDIIFHHNEQNVERILNQWPNDLYRPSLYYWKGDNGSEWASLHSKLIMIDQKKMLLTSANFTLHGFQKNIETGLLVENHELCQVMWRQFRSLLQNKEMIKY